MAWTYDIPSGTYKNFTLSDKMREQAAAEAVFPRFMSNEPGFGKKKGDTYTITRILQLGLASRVSETDRLPSGRPALETKSVTISEWGFKIPTTQFEQNLSKYDIMNPFQSMLRTQIKLTMDKMCADALKKTPIVYVPTATSFTLTTNGTPGATSDRNLGISDLREIHDYMQGTLKCPPYANGKYVGVLSTKAARGIKNDPEYKDWIAPTSSEPLMNGQLKDVEGFTLVETNHYNALSNLQGASTTTGQAIFFGADAGAILEVDAPEIRMGIPEDLGRFRDVGWVGTLESFLVWESASLARAVLVSSS
jgi:N4-gp56 family major capsid protein